MIRRQRLISPAVLAYLLAVSLILTSCHGSAREQKERKETDEERAMNSWMGSHESELIASWGAPARTTSDAKGGKILIYEQRVVFTNGMPVTRVRQFFVDKDGRIYHWMASGEMR